MRSSPRLLLLVALALLAPMAGSGEAASVVQLAGLADPAPGGGVFAGSGFQGAPAAAGDGWVAFRSLIADGSTSEQLVLARMTAGAQSRTVVASIGAGAGDGLGTIAGFLGNPAVNADGDVVFLATLSGADDLPDDPDLPTPAALFLYDRSAGTVTPLLLSRQATPAGSLALGDAVDPRSTFNESRRSPRIDDAGNVAFSTATFDGDGNPGAALAYLPAGGALTLVAAAGDAQGGSQFVAFGPPALDGNGVVVFRGMLSGGSLHDGIFRWESGGLTTLAQNGLTVTTSEPEVHLQTVSEFADGVAIDAAGDVAFLASPVLDYTFDPGEPGFALLLAHGGMVDPLAYPGQPLELRGRITDVALEAEFSSDPPAPAFAADGAAFAYVMLNGGSSEALVRVAGAGANPTTVIAFGGTTPTASPLGGSYLAATAAPTVDAGGAVAGFARLSGGPASDALVYRPDGAASTAIAVGEASSTGIFAGPPFSNPAINDTGDVVFRAFVAAGPAGLGLYRWRQGVLTPIVRVGDPAPVPGNPPFTNIVGEHDVNDAGTVVFSAVVGDLGRGIYTVGTTNVQRIAAVGDPGPAGIGTDVTFVNLVASPGISDDGSVAFRGRVEYKDGGGATRRKDGIFVRAGSQVRALALVGDPSPEGLPFYRFRDLALRRGVRVAFTASLGTDGEEEVGMFVAEPTSLGTIAIVGDSLAGRLTALSGRPAIDRTGAATILARVGTSNDDHAAIVKGNTGSVSSVVEVGDAGPAGGIFRSLGRPAMCDAGRVAFRATFEPGSGGTGGFFLATENGLEPYLGVGDAAPISTGGRLSSFNQRAALSSDDALAFIATVSGGNIDNGLFLASPSTFDVKRLKVVLGTPTKADRMTLRAQLDPGPLSNGLDPASERLVLTVRDAGSAMWNLPVQPGGFRKKGGVYVFRNPPDVGKVVLKVKKRSGRLKIAVKARPDFTGGGVFPFEMPARVRIELGDVSGQAVAPCKQRGRALTCK